MKCDNCGSEFKSSLKCPLCGHYQGKISHCAVCGTTISYGQTRCLKCGNPTKYSKKIDVRKNYYGSFTTTDNSKTDYTNHNQESHQYGQQEMYDYKSSNAEIKNRLNEARQRLNQIYTPMKKGASGDKQLQNIIIAIVVVIIGAVTIFGQLFNKDDEDQYVYSDLSTMEVVGNNSNLTNAGNYNQYGYAYLLDDEIYLTQHSALTINDRNFMVQDWLSDIGGSFIYVEGEYQYSLINSEYNAYSRKGGNDRYLFTADKVFPIKHQRFLYTDINTLGMYLYKDGDVITITDLEIQNFTFDYQNNLVYLVLNNKVLSVDLYGQRVGEYELKVYGDIYVNDGIIYYDDYEGIKKYNTSDATSELIYEDDDINNFIMSENGIVYLNNSHDIYYYDFNEEISNFISYDIDVYNVIGDKIVFSSDRYDRGMLSDWYVARLDGSEIAKINDVNEE